MSLYVLKCSWAHTVLCRFIYCYFANIGHTDIMWSVVWSYCWLKSALLFLFSVHLLHDIGLLSDLVLLLLDYQFLLSGLSLIAIKHVFFTNNLSTHTAYYCPCINLLSSFFLRTHLILLLYALCLFVSLLSFVWINSSTTFAAILIVDFIFAFMAFSNMYKLVFFVFDVQVFCNISYFSFVCITSVCNKPLVILVGLICEHISTLSCVLSELAAPSRMKQWFTKHWCVLHVWEFPDSYLDLMSRYSDSIFMIFLFSSRKCQFGASNYVKVFSWQ